MIGGWGAGVGEGVGAGAGAGAGAGVGEGLAGVELPHAVVATIHTSANHVRRQQRDTARGNRANDTPRAAPP